MVTLGSGARKQSDSVADRTMNGRDGAGAVPFEAKLVATVGSIANKNKLSDS